MFKLTDRPFGKVRSAEELAIMAACEELYVAFCDLIDAGELDKAVEMHTEDLAVYQEGRPEPLVGLQKWRARLQQMRFSYRGRVTLHTPSNFRFHRVTAQEAECRVITSLYDLVRNPEGRGISRYSTELVGYAAEEARFVPVNGLWRFKIRQVRFLAGAKRLAIGTLPGELPWEAMLPPDAASPTK